MRVGRAARVARRGGGVGGRRDALAARRLGRREDHRELQHRPRPDAQDHLAQVAVVLHLRTSNTIALITLRPPSLSCSAQMSHFQ